MSTNLFSNIVAPASLLAITALSGSLFSPLSAHASADDTQIGACDLIELVTIIDPSGSVNPDKQLCMAIEIAWGGLDPEMLRTTVIAEDQHQIECSDGFVEDLYPLSLNWVEGTSIDSSEDWGDAVSVVCSSHPWGVRPRILVVFSDECAEGGDDVGFPCDVQETGAIRCGLEDDLAVGRAVQAALNNDVRVIAVATEGACTEVVGAMHRLATDTGGRIIEQARLQDPSISGLGMAIRERVVSLMPEFWSRCCEDLDRDGAVGAADLGTLLGSWGLSDPAIDLDQSGTVDAGDLARVLGAWGGCR